MAALQYADIFSNILRELYGQSQVSVDTALDQELLQKRLNV